MDMLNDLTKGAGNGFILFRDDERFYEQEFVPPPISFDNFEQPWERVGRPPLYISTLSEKATR